MQIIQTIRDKAAISIIVIALSLIGFLLMDAKSGNNFFKSLSNNLGSVNGNEIDKATFEKKLKFAEQSAKQQAQQSGQQAPDAGQIREQVWNQSVAESVFYAEADKLGITFTSPEFSAILKSNDQSNPFMQDQSMIDPATGKLDESKVINAIVGIKKAKGDQLESINQQLTEPQKIGSISNKYSALLNASVYYPKWMQEKDNADTKNFANISYVSIPYNVISDSTVVVKDEEINEYVQNHKNEFKQEAGRTISYVAFSQNPSTDDSVKAKEIISALLPSFTTDNNTKAFIAKNGSVIEFDSNYMPKSRIKSSYIDTIAKHAVGTVYGPYVDGGNYVLAKYLGSRVYPDSATARHILIPTTNPQNGQTIADDSTTKKRADSILNAIKSGADFGRMAVQFSSDGSKDKGGDLGTFAYATMVPEFNEFCFNKPVGSMGVVKTQFGYHIIQLLAQKGASPKYKIAFMAKEILPSDATIQNSNLNATKLAAQKNTKDFESYCAKNGLQKISNPSTIKENDFSIGQLKDARQLVRWIFEAKPGDVSEPFNIGEQYVVANVEKVFTEGTQDVKTARPMAEGAVRNRKKAAIIIKNIGETATLETAGAKYNKQVETAGADSSIVFNARIIPNIGDEPKLIGACFNKENTTKVSSPIVGKNGVYLLKVNSINAKAQNNLDVVSQQKNQKISTLRNQTSNWFEGLKNQATIKDNRSKFY